MHNKKVAGSLMPLCSIVPNVIIGNAGKKTNSINNDADDMQPCFLSAKSQVNNLSFSMTPYTFYVVTNILIILISILIHIL